MLFCRHHQSTVVHSNVWILRRTRKRKKPHNSVEYLSTDLTLHLHGKDRLAEELSKMFASFFQKMEDVNATKNDGVSINEVPTQLLKAGPQPFSYCLTFETFSGNLVGYFVRRSLENYSNTVRLLRYRNHTCHYCKIKGFFKAYCCLSTDQLESQAWKMSRKHNNLQWTFQKIFPYTD